MHDRQISLAKLLATLAWLPVLPALAASWLLDVPALAGFAVCCAVVACTLVLLRDNNRTRQLVRLTSRPESSAGDTVRGLR